MRVILFIGHHKVGSTSLQSYLAENYAALAKEGVLYPMTDMQGLSLQLARTTGTGATDPLPINAREAHNALAFRMMAEVSDHRVPPFHKNLPATRQMFFAVEEQIKAMSPHTVVLCAEVLANFGGFRRGTIEKLLGLFRDASEVTITATLRRPDEYLASWQGQRLKFNHRMEPLTGVGLDHYLPSIHFNYRTMVEPWINALAGTGPAGRVLLRDYADVLDAGGSVADFLAQNGITAPAGARAVPNANPSIPLACHEIARRGNIALTPADAGILRRYLLDLGDRVALPPNAKVEMFGQASRDRLMSAFAPIHDWLGAKTGQAPFFRDFDALTHTRPLPADRAAADILPALLRDARTHLESDTVRQFLAQLAEDGSGIGGTL